MSISTLLTNQTVNPYGTGVPLTAAVMKVYSRMVEHKAMPVLRFSKIAILRTELLTEPGDTIVFSRYNDIADGGELDEEQDLVPVSMSMTQRQITIKEWGNAVALTERLMRSSWDDLLSEAIVLLVRDYAKVRDRMIRDAAATTSNVIYAGDVDAKIDVTAPLSSEDISRVIEELSTSNAPTFLATDTYFTFIHPHQTRQLKNDDAITTLNLTTGGANIMRGVVGTYDMMQFVETTMARNGGIAGTPGYTVDLDGDSTNGGGGDGSVDLYEAIVFADYAVAEAIGLRFTIRHDGIQNFGRRIAVGWIWYANSDLLEEGHVFRILSAA